mgnify:CR=1 FL=1
MHGIIAAVPTPLCNNGDPIHDIFISHCSWLLENGCDGINILGTTGEANSLNNKQRIALMKFSSSRLNLNKLMVGTGTPSLSETISLTETADDLGYKVALVLPPYYYKPATNLGLFDWYKTLHMKLNARKIKVFFYNFPQMTGIQIPIEIIKKLNQLFPERFTGIKDSSGDLSYCHELSKISQFSVFPSSEVSIGEAHKCNFSGCISATANQTSSLCAIAWENRANKNITLIGKIKVIRERIASDSLIASIKFLVSLKTKNKEWCNILPPLNKLNNDRKEELLKLNQNL